MISKLAQAQLEGPKRNPRTKINYEMVTLLFKKKVFSQNRQKW
jgi:hypothetical protein